MKSRAHLLPDPGDTAAGRAGSIQLSKVTRAYDSAGESFLAVNCVDLRIPSGQFVAVAFVALAERLEAEGRCPRVVASY
jgi:hypothetical protein